LKSRAVTRRSLSRQGWITLSRADHQATPQGRVSLGVGWRWRCCSSSAQWPRPMHRSAAVMAAGKITSNRHRNGPRHRRHRSCPRYGHGWKRARSYASRATISSDIRRKSPMVRVLQHQDRRSIAILSGSRRASSFWLTTVPHAPKSSRRTSPKRPGGPIATCRRPRHLLSPKAQAQGNDGPALGFLGNKGAPLLGDRAPAVFRRSRLLPP
jgi:hypothetical protein